MRARDGVTDAQHQPIGGGVQDQAHLVGERVAATGAVIAGSAVPASGWTVSYGVDTSGANLVDPTKAALGLHLVGSGAPLTSTTAGSLWLVTFSIKSGASGSTVPNLVPSAKVGASIITTNATGANKTYQLSPAGKE